MAVSPVAQADAIEAAAYRDLVAAAPAAIRRETGARASELAGATLLIAPGAPLPLFNRVIGLGMHQPAQERHLDAAIAEYRRSGCAEFWVHVSPGSQPAELPRWLETRGLAPPQRKSWAKMLRGRVAPPEIDTRLQVRRALPGDGGRIGTMICAAYGLPAPFAEWFDALPSRPRWRAHVALEDARIVAAGFLFLDDTRAWLGAAGTLSEFRRRGAQGALMARRISDAIEVGCTVIATETGEPVGDEPNPSLQNMRRCGFEQVASRLNYACRFAGQVR